VTTTRTVVYLFLREYALRAFFGVAFTISQPTFFEIPFRPFPPHAAAIARYCLPLFAGMNAS